jgi:hypothetical protein
VEAHVSSCARCRAALEEVRAGIAATSHLQMHEAPESLWAKVEAAIIASPSPITSNQLETSNPLNREPRGIGRYRMNPLTMYAAIALLVAITYPLWRPPNLGDPNRPGWFVAKLTGAPKIQGDRITFTTKLGTGELLETDSSSSARIYIADIGEAKVDPNSRLRLVKTGKDAHRMSLEIGRIVAEVSAPPRLFQVSTPSTLAVDLGCAYTLEVDANGTSKLHVTKGWVSLESGPIDPKLPPGKTGSYVPAYALCETRKDRVPGIPVFSDAAQGLKDAVASFDNDPNVAEQSVRTLLPLARLRDTLSLWHLLQRTDGALREAVLDRMLKLTSLPSDANRQQALDLEPELMDRWRKLLEFDW